LIKNQVDCLLVLFLQHRIGDERIIRLVRKWLKAGVLDDGVWSVSDTGTPQGAVISPLLANVFLHYVFDLWAVQWRRREATGNAIFVRYADDIVAGFEHEADARRFWNAMRERFEQFGLELHGVKDAFAGVRQQCSRTTQTTKVGKARDIHVSWVHLHLRKDPKRRSLSAPAKDKG
jgi:hypothetical protein